MSRAGQDAASGDDGSRLVGCVRWLGLVTASVGLLRRADRATCTAKAQGGDGVVCAARLEGQAPRG